MIRIHIHGDQWHDAVVGAQVNTCPMCQTIEDPDNLVEAHYWVFGIEDEAYCRPHAEAVAGALRCSFTDDRAR